MSLKATRKYLGGMSLEEGSSRNYEYTIVEGALKGQKFKSNVWTPKVKGEWGLGEEKIKIDGEWIDIEKAVKILAMRNVDLKSR